MLKKVLFTLCLPIFLTGLEWKSGDIQPFNGERIIFVRVNHDNQAEEIAWITHFNSSIHDKFTKHMSWASIEGREKEVFELGIPFFYTP